MLALSKETEVNRQLAKEKLFLKHVVDTKTRNRFDSDISRINIRNEISQKTVNIEAGEIVQRIFVVELTLKTQNYNIANINLISKLINQNMIMILKYGDIAKLAVYHTKLFETDWMSLEDINIKLQGLNLDTVWKNIIMQIGNINLQNDNSLDKQIHIDEEKAKINKQIEMLEKQVKKEKQPNKKLELVKEVRKLNKQIDELK